jgi:uncharacterized repeat protein (TIGR01451 family)
MSRQPSIAPAPSPASPLVRRAQRLAAALLVLAVALPGASAGAQAADTVLYAVNNTTTLYAVTNRATGTTGAFATLSFAAIAVARDPVTKRIYYVSGSAPVGRVAYYDPATGTNTVINATGTAPNSILRLGFNAAGVLYAIGDSARQSLLYTINTATGAYTSLGSVTVGAANGLPLPNSGDIAFDPVTGTLYATAYSDPSNCQGGCVGAATALYTIDLTTRDATLVADFGPMTTQTALAFAGTALYSAGADGSLYSLDKTTGVATPVATTAFAFQDFATGTIAADLQITLTASPGFTTGAIATYTLAAANNGPFPATGTITLVDTLPAGLSTPTASGTGWACTVAGQIVTCTRAGPVPSGVALPPVTIAVTVTGSATSVTNTAWIFTLSTPDQNPTNNSSSVTSAVTVYAVATTPKGATATRLPSNGTSYTQVFVVTNSGNQLDSYVVAAAVAPAGILTVTQVNGVAGTTGAISALAAGASANVTVTYTVAGSAATGAAATLTLRATSSTVATVADQGDLTVTVARAGLALAKQLYRDDRTTLVSGAAGVSTGEYVQYRVTVTSTGGADATAVSVSDAIPVQMTYDTAAGDVAGWTFTTASATLTATLTGTLTSGSSRYFWIRVMVK